MAEQLRAGPMAVGKQTGSYVRSPGALTRGSGGFMEHHELAWCVVSSITGIKNKSVFISGRDASWHKYCHAAPRELIVRRFGLVIIIGQHQNTSCRTSIMFGQNQKA